MTHVRSIRFVLALCIILGLALAGAPAWAQDTIAETEPNGTCAAPQSLGAAALPLSVAGSLDTPPETPDADYYRITATPGDRLAIEQRGETSGNGTLFDPFVGVFSSSCGYLAYDDDSGSLGYRDARVEVTVPADGVLVIAASGAWDWEFSGNGSFAGTYTLSVSKVLTALGIGGRVVDSVTGAAVQGVAVMLQSCNDGACSMYAGYTISGPDGSFRFEPGNYTLYSDILRVGEYRLIVNVGHTWVTYFGAPFQVLEGQDLNVGDLALEPEPVVGSIRGRLVDALTGAPLSGIAAPFARVELQSCSPYGCGTARYASTDAQGGFVFESTADRPLPPGTYRIVGSADQYQPTTGVQFEVAEDQHYGVGDFEVKSFPVRINLIQGCGPVPSTGGECTYVVRVTNGNPGKLHGDVWSLVRSLPQYWGDGSTEFQAGNRRTVSLLPGVSTDLTFSFTVPASMEDNTAICARAFTSHKTNPFDSIGARDLFCMAKVGQTFQAMPDEQKRELMKRVK